MASQKKEIVFENKKPKKKNLSLLFIILFCIAVFFSLKIFFPQILFGMGKVLYDSKDYKTSSELFKFAYKFSNKNPDYSFYWVQSLAHQTLTYDVQKDLYDISQFDDKSKAEIYATKVLAYLKKQILARAGENYIEEALNDNQVLRWDLNTQPLKYFVKYDVKVPDYYTSLLLDSFDKWRTKTKGLVNFAETKNKDEAQILVSFVDVDNSKFCHDEMTCEYSVGRTVPVTSDRKLKYMDIKINAKSNLKQFFEPEAISTVMTHEIGHALGIWGHSRFVSDVMFYSADKLYGQTREKQISHRDVNTLKLLYSFAPDITNTNISLMNNQRFLYSPIFIGDVSMSKGYSIERAVKKVNENPNDMNNWLELASRYTTDKQYEKSNQVLSQAIYGARDAQTVAAIYYNMANNYLNLDNYKEALKFANKARQINDDFDTRALIALIKSKNGDYFVAEKAFIKLRKEQPANIDVALNMTDMYLAEKEYVKARDTIKSLVKSNPGAMDDPRLAVYKIYAFL